MGILDGTTGGDGDRHGRSGDIVRHVHHANDVVLAE